MNSMQGKTAVVTGGSSGIGASVVSMLLEEGCRVSVWDLTAPASPDVEWSSVDVTDAESVKAARDALVAGAGTIDILFANAGIAAGRGPVTESGRLENFSLTDWGTVMAVNLQGVLNTLRAVGPVMRKQGSGRIVVTGSTAGLRADPLVSYAYCASKAAVIAIARQAAVDLAPDGVTVNVLAPGPFRTGIGGGRRNEESAWAETVPLRRVGDPDEVKGLARLLASSASSFMTGGVHMVDGGAMLQ